MTSSLQSDSNPFFSQLGKVKGLDHSKVQEKLRDQVKVQDIKLTSIFWDQLTAEVKDEKDLTKKMEKIKVLNCLLDVVEEEAKSAEKVSETSMSSFFTKPVGDYRKDLIGLLDKKVIHELASESGFEFSQVFKMLKSEVDSEVDSVEKLRKLKVMNYLLSEQENKTTSEKTERTSQKILGTKKGGAVSDSRKFYEKQLEQCVTEMFPDRAKTGDQNIDQHNRSIVGRVRQDPEAQKLAFLAACRSKDHEAILKFIQAEEGQTWCDEKGNTALMIAIQNLDPEDEDISHIQSIMSVFEAIDLSRCNEKGETALMMAAEKGLVELAKTQLHKWRRSGRPDKELIDIANIAGRRPLHYVCSRLEKREKEQLDLVEFLVNNKAAIDQKDNEGKTPIMVACESKNESLLEYLFSKIEKEQGIKSQFDDKGKTVLEYICTRESEEGSKEFNHKTTSYIETLCDPKSPADLSTQPESVERALTSLLEHRNFESAALILDTYLSKVTEKVLTPNMLVILEKYVNKKDDENKSILFHAAKMGHFELFNNLVALPKAKIPSKVKSDVQALMDGERKKTSLFVALENKNQKVVKKLLNAGCDPCFKDQQNKSLILLAIEQDQHNIAQLMIDHLANKEFSSDFERLEWAQKQEGLDFIEALKERLSDFPERVKKSLRNACKNGDVEKVKELIELGVDVKQPVDKKENSALHFACLHGRSEVVKLLLEKGDAQANQSNRDGVTPFMLACQQADKIDLEDFFKLGEGEDVEVIIDTSLVDKKGNNALHYYAKSLPVLADRDFTEHLIQMGADPKVANQRDRTPLYYACRNNRFESVNAMIAKVRQDVPKSVVDDKTEEGLGDLQVGHEGEDEEPTVIAAEGVALFEEEKISEEESAAVQEYLMQSDNKGMSPFLALCRHKIIDAEDAESSMKIMKCLDENGFKIGFDNEGMQDAFKAACQSKNIPVVSKLFRYELIQDWSLIEKTSSRISVSHYGGILNQAKKAVQLTDALGNCVMHYAVKENDLELLKSLFVLNPEMNKRNQEGISPLGIACMMEEIEHEQKIDIIRFMIEHGAKISDSEVELFPNLNEIFVELLTEISKEEKGSIKKFKALFRAKIGSTSLRTQLSKKQKYMFAVNAIANKNLKITNYMINHIGGKGALKENNATSMLKWLINQSELSLEEMRPALMQLVKQKQVDLNVKNKKGETLLMLALQDKDTDLIQAMRDCPNSDKINANILNKNKQNALIIACQWDNLVAVDWLLDNTDDVNHLDLDGKTALIHAVESGHPEVIKQFSQEKMYEIEQKVDFTIRSQKSIAVPRIDDSERIVENMENLTAFESAIINKSIDCIGALLEIGQNVNVRNDENSSFFYEMTPLMIACQRGDSEVVEKLLSAEFIDCELVVPKELKGKNIAFTGAGNNHPLWSAAHFAAESGNGKIIRLLHEKSIELRLPFGLLGLPNGEVPPKIPIEIALNHHRMNAVEEFFDLGFYIPPEISKKVDEDGNNLLHFSCQKGHLQSMIYINPFELKAMCNRKNHKGELPFHFAIKNPELDEKQVCQILTHLSKAEANLLGNIGGKSPVRYAIENEKYEVAETLLLLNHERIADARFTPEVREKLIHVVLEKVKIDPAHYQVLDSLLKENSDQKILSTEQRRDFLNWIAKQRLSYSGIRNEQYGKIPALRPELIFPIEEEDPLSRSGTPAPSESSKDGSTADPEEFEGTLSESGLTTESENELAEPERSFEERYKNLSELMTFAIENGDQQAAQNIVKSYGDLLQNQFISGEDLKFPFEIAIEQNKFDLAAIFISVQAEYDEEYIQRLNQELPDGASLLTKMITLAKDAKNDGKVELQDQFARAASSIVNWGGTFPDGFSEEKIQLLDWASAQVPAETYVILRLADEGTQLKPEHLTAKDADGNTVLTLAAKIGSLEKVEKFIDLGADLNAFNNQGETALMVLLKRYDQLKAFASDVNFSQDWALRERINDLKQFITDLMSKHQLDIKMETKSSESGSLTPWHYVAAYADSKLYTQLTADTEIDLNLLNANGETALHMAVSTGNSEMALKLIELGASLEILDRNGDTALMRCIKEVIHSESDRGYSQSQILDKLIEKQKVKLLVEQGEENLSPFSIAFSGDNFGLLEKFLTALEEEGLMNLPNSRGMTPLMLACEAGKVDSIRKIKESGGDVNFSNSDGLTAIEIAVQSQNQELIDLLVELGAEATDELIKKLNTDSKAQEIVEAIEENNLEKVKSLFNEGAVVKSLVVKNAKGGIEYLSPLELALKKENYDLAILVMEHLGVEELSEHIESNDAEIFLTKCLELASNSAGEIRDKYNQAACMLIQAEINLQPGGGDNKKQQLMDWVLEQDHPTTLVIYRLIESGLAAEENHLLAQDEEGWTALHWAIMSDSFQTASEIINAGSLVTAGGDADNVPIQMILEKNMMEVMDSVIDQLKEKELLDTPIAGGKTLLQYAINKENYSLVQKLIRAGVNVNQEQEGMSSPLESAVKSGQKRLVHAMLEAGGKVTEKMLEIAGQDPASSIWRDLMAFGGAELLLNAEKSLVPDTTRILQYERSMIKACMENDTETLQKLFDKGANMNFFLSEPPYLNYMPIEIAFHSHNPEAVLLLLNRGASVKRIMEQGRINEPFNNGKNLTSNFLEMARKETDEKRKDLLYQAVSLLSPMGGTITESSEEDKKQYLDWAAAQSPAHTLAILELAMTDIPVEKKHLEAQDKTGNTPLHYAAMNGAVKKLKEFLALNPNINLTNKMGESVAMIAMKRASYDRVDADALEKNNLFVKAEETREKSESLYQLAAQLLDKEDRSVEGRGPLPLHYACASGNMEILEKELDKVKEKGLLDQRDSEGKGLIHYGVMNFGKVNLEVLIDDPDVDKQAVTDFGDTALHTAAAQKGVNISIFSDLVQDAKIDINSRNNQGETPLVRSVIRGTLFSADELIRLGADIEQADNDGNTALNLAIQEGNYARGRNIPIVPDDFYTFAAKLIRESDAELMKSNNKGISPFSLATVYKPPVLIDAIIERFESNPEEVNKQDSNGKTPLALACRIGATEMVKRLVEIEGIDLNLVDQEGKSPLFRACESESVELVNMLLDKGAMVSEADLEYAREIRNIEILELLLSKSDYEVGSDDILRVDATGASLLMYACMNGHKEVVEKIFAKAEEVETDEQKYEIEEFDARDKGGFTPFMAACCLEDDSIANLFVEKGKAQITVRDLQGKTPADYAKIFGHNELADQLTA